MSISSDRHLLLNEGITRTKTDYYPIRLQERTLSFQVTYPATDKKTIDELKTAITSHHTYAISVGQPSLMTLNVVLADRTLTYLGLIEQVHAELDRYAASYTKTFTMKLQNKLLSNQSRIALNARNDPYVPGVKDVQRGGDWWDIQ
jgi:hypothetical protein